jgi:hypothetical protein
MKKLIVPLLAALLSVYASAITPPGSTAEGQVKGSVAEASVHTSDVFKKMGIQPTGSKVESSGVEQTLEGKKGDLNVWVKLEKVKEAQNQTKVEVTAKKEGALTWNNDFAKSVLEHIIATS